METTLPNTLNDLLEAIRLAIGNKWEPMVNHFKAKDYTDALDRIKERCTICKLFTGYSSSPMSIGETVHCSSCFLYPKHCSERMNTISTYWKLKTIFVDKYFEEKLLITAREKRRALTLAKRILNAMRKERNRLERKIAKEGDRFL